MSAHPFSHITTRPGKSLVDEVGVDAVEAALRNAGVRGFMIDVLVELSRTRAGETLTYGELAARAGRPRAARAAGSACAKNPFAPQIPCHRVVKADGGLGNYSGPGGVETKRSLLDREAALGAAK
jgi:methylated-DNA-[protein]-cysteine S-methyltransferase